MSSNYHGDWMSGTLLATIHHNYSPLNEKEKPDLGSSVMGKLETHRAIHLAWGETGCIPKWLTGELPELTHEPNDVAKSKDSRNYLIKKGKYAVIYCPAINFFVLTVTTDN